MAKNQLTQIRELIEAGNEPLQIADLMGLDIEKVEAGVREIFETIVSRIQAMPREHMYAELLLAATAHMRQLNKIAIGETTLAGDKVGAIKASWAIRKSLLAEARDLGLVPKNPDAKIEGIDIAFAKGMDIAEIKHRLLQMLKDFKNLDAQYKQVGIMSVNAGSLFGETVDESETN